MTKEFTVSKMETANHLRDQATKTIENCFSECVKCDGTGLAGINKHETGFSWDGGFCEECKGSGYDGWEESELLFICGTCKGFGKDNHYGRCPDCKGEGVFDWIQHMMGRK